MRLDVICVCVVRRLFCELWRSCDAKGAIGRVVKSSTWKWQYSDCGSLLCVYLQKCHHNSVSITQKHLKLFSLLLTHYSKIIELSDGNKIRKQIQIGFLSVDPTIFDWSVMETGWWVMETPKSKQPLIFYFPTFPINQICLN